MSAKSLGLQLGVGAAVATPLWILYVNELKDLTPNSPLGVALLESMGAALLPPFVTHFTISLLGWEKGNLLAGIWGSVIGSCFGLVAGGSLLPKSLFLPTIAFGSLLGTVIGYSFFDWFAHLLSQNDR